MMVDLRRTFASFAVNDLAVDETIRPGTNSTAYYAIRSVLLEEMLHMTLAANLLNAVGGEPRVADPEFIGEYPVALPMSSSELDPIHLRHFSKKALRTFLDIERPRSFTVDGMHEGQGWTSIGQFYETVRQGLVALVHEHGEAKVFTGAAHKQVGPEHFYNSGGEAFRITDLKSAQTAIEVISEQGEGVHGSIWDSDDQVFGEERQLAHYFRFNEIHTGRRYSPNDVPDLPPSGPLVDVSWEDAYTIDGLDAAGQALAFKHLNHKTIAYADIAGKGKSEISFAEVPLESACDYACETEACWRSTCLPCEAPPITR
jgi:hypothetical protein